MLFPLPLTSFENYMLADDREDYPMSFFLRLHFWGKLDRAAFTTAVEQTITRHPLFRAFVRTIDGQLTWIPAHDAFPHITWNETDELAPEEAGYLDLTREIGLRISVSQNDGQTTVLFQFHHACTDGIGAVQFIEDLLAIYTTEHSGSTQQSRLRPLKTLSLVDRGRHGLNVFGRLLRLPVDLLASFGIAQFFCNRPKAIETPVRPQPVDDAVPARPASFSHRISAAELKDLRKAAKQRGVTVNDLMIRDLLLAIDTWNARHNPAARDNCLRISVPVNLRRPEDATLPAANVVSMVFMDRRVGVKTNPRRLLASIWRDTWFIKRLQLALVFTWVIETLHAVRGGFAWLFGGEESLATAVLSNLGVQFDDLPLAYLGDHAIVGDAVLERIDFMPPIRHKTSAAFGVVTYAGELMLSLQYDSRSLSAEAAEDLCVLFATQIAATVGRTPQPIKPAVVEAKMAMDFINAAE